VLAPLGWHRTEIRREIADKGGAEVSGDTDPAKN